MHGGNRTCRFAAFTLAGEMLNKIDEKLGYGPIRRRGQRPLVPQQPPAASQHPITTPPYSQACVVAGCRASGGKNAEYDMPVGRYLIAEEFLELGL